MQECIPETWTYEAMCPTLHATSLRTSEKLNLNEPEVMGKPIREKTNSRAITHRSVLHSTSGQGGL